MSAHDSAELAAARPDFAAIAEWIPKGASVLDLGCGDGSLLRFLRDTREVRGYGVEISDANIVACIKNGVNVIQGDLDSGLSGFETLSFDYVILSQTLQATRHTEALVQEILRVGRAGIVSFPNFGYWRNRLKILRGNMPVRASCPTSGMTRRTCICAPCTTSRSFAPYKMCKSKSPRDDGESEVKVLPNLFGQYRCVPFQRGT